MNDQCIIKFPNMTDQNQWIDFVREARKFYPEATPLNFKNEADFKIWLDDIIRLNLGNNLKPGENPSSTFFMWDQGRIVGYLTIKRTKVNLNTIGQLYINIRPSDRKKGYGDKLLKQGIQKCREINIKQIMVSVPVDSVAGNKIVTNNGGTVTEVKELNGSGIKMNIYTINI